MTDTIEKLNRDSSLSLRLICSEQKDATLKLILMTHEFVYNHPDGVQVFHVTGPKMYNAFVYFMDSFEHIYFNVNNYITSKRNLRQVNSSLYWLNSDYQKFKGLPGVDEVVKHAHQFYKIIFHYGLLAVEAYEALAKLKKAEERIDNAIKQLK